MDYIKNPEFIRKIPKSDLHLHLDGSIRINTFIELAKKHKVKLPSYTEEGIRELIFKEQYKNLGEYLEGFKYVYQMIKDPEDLERIAYELVWDNFAEGVRYIEVRFAPQLHINDNMSMEEILLAVNRGLKKAADQINSDEKIKSGEEPPFYYGIIVCAMRMFTKELSPYYQEFIKIHKYSKSKTIYALASLELAKAAVFIRDKYKLPIVGFDLAGQEAGYPAGDHKEAYRYAHKYFLKKTVHAGEAYGPESIFQAITDLYADRLGHCYHLFNYNMIKDPNITDKEKYVEDLVHYIADRRITVEVCLTSNKQTMPFLDDIKKHSFKKMIESRLSVSICTDNRTISNTSVSKEMTIAINNFNINPKMLKNIVIYGFKRSFFPDAYLIKRKYVRQIIDYYEKIEREFAENSN